MSSIRLLSEKRWERKLNIHTSGRDDSAEDGNRFPYEPTPYSVLERLVENHVITAADHVIDYGSGKGRVAFFLRHQTSCRVTGVEFNQLFVFDAEENKQRYSGDPAGIRFLLQPAETYEIPDDVSVFWFFNPFSVNLLRSVLARISASLARNPREMKLLFYYPSDEYVSLLMTCDELQFDDEIDCRDLFPGKNNRERIIIFRTI